uniref:Uncharacterized protein n=1 Tax=Siphoviridae sp. ct96x5 TaxID=2825367 RepID=A0A8S5PR48_9CAUD|nr:MAG TPA: hypothetical protein [Siphoviridae sp. ct96x5]DAJ39362.1 MAG TPA: hypothetical protein [Caudoviricetes sp.]DAO21381.1 MAG TPA: hypothetical protein [Caudoviricetes sp.]
MIVYGWHLCRHLTLLLIERNDENEKQKYKENLLR